VLPGEGLREASMAFFQEAKASREPFLNAPPCVLGLIAIILAAHVARVLIPEVLSNQFIETYALVPARYVPAVWAAQGGAPVSFLHGAIPFVSYMFLHADFLHVGVNCLWLLVAGTPVARRLGTVKFLILFLVSGMLAAATYLVLNWGSFGAAIGASGAVSGMMGAAIRIFYGDRLDPASSSEGQEKAPATGEATGQQTPASSSEAVGPQRLAPLLGTPILFFSAIWCVANVVAGLTGLGTTGNMQAVAWEAHLGGYFAGLFLIGPFDASWRRHGVSPA
jgi:membrane associated rhomboid family serine protease